MPGAGIRTLVGFARALRDAGLPCGPERVVAYCRAVDALAPAGPSELWWAGRLTLVGHREDLPVYDRVFGAYFAGTDTRSGDTVGGPPRGRFRVAEAVDEESLEAPEDDGDAAARARASRTEVLRRKDFEEQTAAERETTARLVARLGVHTPKRLSRRYRPSRRGRRPDLGRTLRRSMRTYGEPIDRGWRRRRTKPRRLVVVFDVSGSMESYTKPLARFAHAAVRTGGLVEAFAFGTRLTRVTPALRSRDPDRALGFLGGLVGDWHGGTRIGESLAELIDGWGRGPLRGAVVVICSDGLDRGDPDLLVASMERLCRLAHRIIWVNPLKGSPAYEPLARGMAAALPYTDDFLSGHNLASLEALVRILVERAA